MGPLERANLNHWTSDNNNITEDFVKFSVNPVISSVCKTEEMQQFSLVH
jgi:hypothetical protein